MTTNVNHIKELVLKTEKTVFGYGIKISSRTSIRDACKMYYAGGAATTETKAIAIMYLADVLPSVILIDDYEEEAAKMLHLAAREVNNIPITSDGVIEDVRYNIMASFISGYIAGNKT